MRSHRERSCGLGEGEAPANEATVEAGVKLQAGGWGWGRRMNPGKQTKSLERGKKIGRGRNWRGGSHHFEVMMNITVLGLLAMHMGMAVVVVETEVRRMPANVRSASFSP